MQIYFFSIKQILQSGLRVKDNKSDFTFHDKSGNIVLLTTPNLWNNIQIVRICILKHNILYHYHIYYSRMVQAHNLCT